VLPDKQNYDLYDVYAVAGLENGYTS